MSNDKIIKNRRYNKVVIVNNNSDKDSKKINKLNYQ